MAWLKRIIITLFILVAALLASSYFGLVKIPLPPLPFFKPAEINLTYWGLWEDENTIKPLIAEYKQSHPNVTINYTKQAKFQYRERLQNALTSASGPDIFRFHNTWLPMLVSSLSPLPEKIMSASLFQSTFYPVHYENLKSNNQIYGIPLEIDTLALFYNEDLFQKGGVTVPKTWEELRFVANRLTVRDEDNRIKIAGVALGTAGNIEHFSDILGLMFLQNSTDPKKISSTIAKDGHNLGEDTLKFYTNFTLLDRVWDETMDNSINAFAGGKVAMIFAPSWEVFEIKNLNPNLPFKVASMPQLPQSSKNWATYWAEGVSNKSSNQQAAWEFLQFLSSKESLQKMYENASKIRLFGEPYPRLDMASLISQDPMAGPFVAQAKNNTTSWYFASRTYDNGLNDKNIKYLEDAVNSVLRGEEAIKALLTAEQGINQVLERYQLP